MDKEGIGTDATISEHIATILKRNYAEKNPANRFLPTNIGLALVETYMYLELPLYKPFLRAHMEQECSRICDGSVHFQEVIDSCIGEMVSVYSMVSQKKQQFKETFIQFMRKTISGSVLKIASVASVLSEHLIACKICGNDMALMGQKRGNTITRFLQCTSCSLVLNLPPKGELQVTSATCPICSFNVLQVTNATSYHLCPYCYSNPSQANHLQSAQLGVGTTLPCFLCQADCPYASSGWMDDSI